MAWLGEDALWLEEAEEEEGRWEESGADWGGGGGRRGDEAREGSLGPLAVEMLRGCPTSVSVGFRRGCLTSETEGLPDMGEFRV